MMSSTLDGGQPTWHGKSAPILTYFLIIQLPKTNAFFCLMDLANDFFDKLKTQWPLHITPV